MEEICSVDELLMRGTEEKKVMVRVNSQVGQLPSALVPPQIVKAEGAQQLAHLAMAVLVQLSLTQRRLLLPFCFRNFGRSA